jgi:hypothetical protein
MRRLASTLAGRRPFPVRVRPFPRWACFKQWGPNSCLAERRGTAVTSDNINGTAVSEYRPTEISAPVRAISTSTCASPPTAPPTQPRIPARNVRFFTCNCRGPARLRLSARAEWIRTARPPSDGPPFRYKVVFGNTAAICVASARAHPLAPGRRSRRRRNHGHATPPRHAR